MFKRTAIVLIVTVVSTNAHGQTMLDKFFDSLKPPAVQQPAEAEKPLMIAPAIAPVRHHRHHRSDRAARNAKRLADAKVAEAALAQAEADTVSIMQFSVAYDQTFGLVPATLLEDAWLADFNRDGPPEDEVWPQLPEIDANGTDVFADLPAMLNAETEPAPPPPRPAVVGAPQVMAAAGSAAGVVIGVWIFIFRRQRMAGVWV